MNKSDFSNGFDFENALDISQNPRDTTHYFTKEGFGFDDFMDINKTFKSEKQSQLARETSSVFRPNDASSFQQGNDSNNDKLSNHQKVPERKHNLSISDSMGGPSNIFDATSPKFPQGTIRSLDISQTNKDPSLRVSKKSVKILTSALKIEEQPLEQVSSDRLIGKQQTRRVNKLEQEYLELEGSIRYYNEAMDRMAYESHRMEAENEEMAMVIATSSQEAEVEQYARQIREINKAIQDETNLEVQLDKMVKQLEQDYDNAINSVKNATFPRPTLVRDEAKALIDQINDIRTQLEGLERDEGSLNLSSTLIPNQGSKTRREENAKGSRQSMKILKEIWEQNKVSEDPRFIHNIKMSCFRQEWNIYSNSEIQIRVSYRNCPKIKILIGNKSSNQLQKFTLKEQDNQVLSGETIAGKSYFKHQVDIGPEQIQLLFIKYELSYCPVPEAPTKTVQFFVPSGYANFGGFMPITAKEFANEAGQETFQHSLPFTPIDKRLIGSVSEAQLLMPNLLLDRQETTCFGMFVSFFNEDTFISIEQRGQMLGISSRSERWPLLHLLQFIFTM